MPRITMELKRIKTETSVLAADPWNQDRSAPFAIEDYMYLVRGQPLKPGAKSPSGFYILGLRSDIDGVERIMPESLSILWRNKQVPSEALPRLLKQIQPSLGPRDHFLFLQNNMMAISIWVLWAVFALMAGAFMLLPFTGEISQGTAALFALAALALGSTVLYFAYYRKRSQRLKQMKWIMSLL